MSTTELFITSIVVAAIWGALAGIIVMRILVVDPMKRDLSRALRVGKRAVTLAEHRGTPYRPETVARAVGAREW